MLQQTQTATTLPFYQRFIERFPTVQRLAQASEAQVLAAWSGLGYYRRARHLLAAARRVVGRHAGQIPRDEGDFGRLPGVGRYTRAAVLSIAFDLPLPVLDGNVGRVISRLWMLPHSARDPRGAAALWKLAGTLVPMRSPGDWNQALMELGATVCTPRAPRCDQCPVRGHCAAFACGAVDRYPPVVRRKPSVSERRAIAVLERDGRVLLVRRSGSLLHGLWEPPGVELASRAAGTAPRSRLPRPSRPPAALLAELARLGVPATLRATPHRIRHGIMNRSISVDVWKAVAGPEVGALERGQRRDADCGVTDSRAGDSGVTHSRAGHSPAARRRSAIARWVDLRSPDVPITGLTRKLARAIL